MPPDSRSTFRLSGRHDDFYHVLRSPEALSWELVAIPAVGSSSRAQACDAARAIVRPDTRDNHLIARIAASHGGRGEHRPGLLGLQATSHFFARKKATFACRRQRWTNLELRTSLRVLSLDWLIIMIIGRHLTRAISPRLVHSSTTRAAGLYCSQVLYVWQSRPNTQAASRDPHTCDLYHREAAERPSSELSVSLEVPT